MYVPISLIICGIFILLVQSGMVRFYSRRAIRLQNEVREIEAKLAAIQKNKEHR